MFLPVKTNDIVQRDGVRYVVKGVSLTQDGPLLELNPIRETSTVVHASEVAFVDNEETVRRAKSVGMSAIKAQRMGNLPQANIIPDGMSADEAKAILRMYSRR